MIQNVIPVSVRATADLVWTETEKRDLQTVFRTYSKFHNALIRNQRDLQTTALEIIAYLEQHS